MFSNAAEYAIKACIWITLNTSAGKRVTINEIAENAQLPRAFTAKTLQILVKHKIVSSVKGPNGGFCIMKNKAENISLLSIVQAIDGNELLQNCVLGLKACSDVKPCPAHSKFKVIRDQIAEFLINTSLKDLSKGIREHEVFLKL